MGWIYVNCAQCGKEVAKSVRNFNENNKYGHKFFCSSTCLANNRKRGSVFVCENPDCQTKFERTPGDISPHNYCSRSCTVVVHNKQRPRKSRVCKNSNCGKKFFGSNIYCSVLCVPKTQPKYSKVDLLYKIQNFYQKYKRIPVKIEFNSHWQAYKRVFGTWNKAIEEAGFEPNQEIFTHRFKARDGHICDSFAEKVIDDWLYKKKIVHQRSIYYPEQTKFKTDFLVDSKYWIEFLGLKGVSKKYDNLYTRKLEIAKNNKINIIELHPTDLFPTNKLKQKLGFLLK